MESEEMGIMKCLLKMSEILYAEPPHQPQPGDSTIHNFIGPMRKPVVKIKKTYRTADEINGDIKDEILRDACRAERLKRRRSIN